MSKHQTPDTVRKEAVGNWPFQPPSFDKSFTLTPLEKIALATWKAHDKTGRGSNAFKKETRQRLNRLIQPIEAVLLHQGVPKGGEFRVMSCVSLLLHEMHRRQTSLWAWDDTAWIETVGKTLREFKSLDHVTLGSAVKSAARDRQLLLACAYLLCKIPIYQLVDGHQPLISAQCMFGRAAVEKAMQTLTAESNRIGRTSWMVSVATCSALLANRCPDFEKLTLPVLEKLYEKKSSGIRLKRSYITLSAILRNLEVLPNCLPTPWKGNRSGVTTGMADALPADWARLIQAWYENSEESDDVRNYMKLVVAKAARWAAEKYPGASSPHQWTRGTARAYVGAVSRMKVGQWQHPKFKAMRKQGEPLRASYQARLLAGLRMFFRDCHEWKWFPIFFNPDRCLATPRSISARQGPNPRPINYAQWTKLCEAGLSLTEEDFPIANPALVKQGAPPRICYPLDMNRAMALVWLHTGMRCNEIHRLRIGCIQPEQPEGIESSSSTPAICFLTVPVGKNGFGYSKPVSEVVGNAVETWERSRPSVPKHRDDKTAEAVDFLFVWRGKRVSYNYLNNTIIPVLCRKAGIPLEDALGKITSHRARHTLATHLGNAPTPMSASDRQNWLGQLTRGSLGYYADENVRKLLDAYATANHISIDKRQLEQLKGPSTTGGDLVTAGESEPSVDLVHGYCTYEFFAKCSQKTPCTNCSFYKPKESLYSQVQEAKSKLLHLLHHLPLIKEARQAVEEAIAMHETMLVHLRSNEGTHPS